MVSSRAHIFLYVIKVVCIVQLTILANGVQDLHATVSKFKRELPLSTSCDPRQQDSCYKGDLIAESVADCKKMPDSLFKMCHPINDYDLSSVVDLANTSENGIDCVADTSCPVICGSPGSDTRCVCDKAVDWRRLKETLFNQCRCQYWPKIDSRKNQPSYCMQFDHGGKSGIHFYTCCNNCNDPTGSSCDRTDYQGGGSKGDYCGGCGENTPKGGGRLTYAFNCVSCEQQSICENKCNREFFGLTELVPGFCPRWAGCFRRCCLDAEQSLRDARLGLMMEYLFERN